MHIVKIPKGNGRFRTIYVPNPEEKRRLSALVAPLNGRALHHDTHRVMHGFMPGRSPVTNALQHRGYAYSLSFDLENFFDHVTPAHVDAVLGFPFSTHDRYHICFVRSRARQGLPTSPALANIAASPMVKEIMSLRQMGRFGWTFVFTTYADDLTFSFDRFATSLWLKRTVPEIVRQHGFKINPEKTRLQSAVAGRRMITGVAVDNTTVLRVPRHIKRKIRAARHKFFKTRSPAVRGQLRGLNEWARLKLPAGYSPPPDGPPGQQIVVGVPLGNTHVVTFALYYRKFP